MKFRAKPYVVEAERVGTILHAIACGDSAALPQWLREGLESGDIASAHGPSEGWLYYNMRIESHPRLTDSESWLVNGPLGYRFALSDFKFRELYEPIEEASEKPDPCKGQVWRSKRPGGAKVVLTTGLRREVEDHPEDFEYVCEKAHDDGDFSYVCTFPHCRCQQ